MVNRNILLDDETLAIQGVTLVSVRAQPFRGSFARALFRAAHFPRAGQPIRPEAGRCELVRQENRSRESSAVALEQLVLGLNRTHL